MELVIVERRHRIQNTIRTMHEHVSTWWRWPVDGFIIFVQVWLLTPLNFILACSRSPAGIAVGIVILALSLPAVYNIFFHPLAQYPGPWYAKASSLPLALMSWYQKEPDWLHILARRYGSAFKHRRCRTNG